MKKFAVIILVFFTACKTVDTNENLMVIPSFAQDQESPLNDTIGHKAGDVEVFRILGADTIYFARLYKLDNAEVRRYEMTIVENVLYDKASFQWLNDSTVAFRLVDTKSKKQKRFNLTGSGASTTVWEE